MGTGQLGSDRRAGRAAALPPAKARRGRKIAPGKGKKLSLLILLSLRHRGFRSPWYPKPPGNRGREAWPR